MQGSSGYQTQKLFSRGSVNVKSNQEKSKLTSDPLSETRQKLDERGEKLEQLSEKFNELEEGSKNFLDNIKAYNEKQSKKKWWQL